MTSFKEQYLNDEVTIQDLDRFVEEWHTKASSKSLQEFLGFTDDELTAFAHGEDKLKKKLDALKSVHHKKEEPPKVGQTGSFLSKINARIK